MKRFTLSILTLLFFQPISFAFNGEKRLSKKNIISIQSNADASLLLNDESGNIFNYDGTEVKQIEFINDIDSPTIILSSINGSLLYVHSNTVFMKQGDQPPKEILTVSKYNKIFKAVENSDFYYIASSTALYQIEKGTRAVIELYENNIEKTDKIICKDENCFLALNNLIINLSKVDIVESSLPEKISSIAFHKQFGLLLLSSDKVYIYDDGTNRKLYPTIGSLPTGIESICGNDQWLFLITENSVSVFDWVNSEVKFLGNFNGNFVSSHIDHWDNLWLSTNQGLWNFSANQRFDSPIITGVEVRDRNNKKLEANSILITRETSILNIIPSIVYMPNSEKLITEWRLENSEWRAFVKDFVISEKMLVDGLSKVFIRSKANNTDYSLPFKIEVNNLINSTKIPSVWYAVLGLIGSLLLLSFISLLNLRSKQNEGRLQIEKLKAENALLQSKQQIDQLQMNPHFIFNALNSINGLIASGKIAESRKAISLFSKFLRQFLFQSSGEDIVLEEEINLLNDYVKIEQICRENKFAFEIELKNNSLLDVMIPNMIIQPFIENAIIHAFTDSNNNGAIKLILREEENYLVALIIDNGIGFSNSETKKKNHKSIAVDLVKKRLSLRDKNRRKSYVEYLDNIPGTTAKLFLQRL